MRHVIFPILAAGLVACGSPTSPEAPSTDDAKAVTSKSGGANPATNGKQENPTEKSGPSTTTSTDATDPSPAVPAGPPKPATEILLEEVYVIMNDATGGTWFCTGSLISKDTVITAGHCLERGRFRNYQITAPLAPGAPTVSAISPTPMSDGFEEVQNPDLGFLKLKTPIDLPAYAVLTDISKDVEAGTPFTAGGVVREEEEPKAPLHEVNDLAVKSTVPDGYAHGFGVTLFSHGGDSGAGLFLVENGHVTHKLIGVARQPDFDSQTDQLTRIDPEILAWLSANGAN